jgi:hypothetical protein
MYILYLVAAVAWLNSLTVAVHLILLNSMLDAPHFTPEEHRILQWI